MQAQLVHDGKMHGFLRMYWAKKVSSLAVQGPALYVEVVRTDFQILEWTESPELALEIAIHFNDKYSLDGRDPVSPSTNWLLGFARPSRGSPQPKIMCPETHRMASSGAPI